VTGEPVRRGAHLVVDALVAGGVRHLFSLSGNQILPLYDATIGSGLSIVHTRHEAAAVHMADAWGRLTEEPGVALVTAAPGHLNAMSALYGALMAESPVVLLSGHSPLGQAGRGAFQEVDQVAAARPVTKAAWLSRDAACLGDDVARALAIAKSGRPGPVHVSLPGDLLEARVADPRRAAPPLVGESAVAPPAAIDDADARSILGLLAAARRPLILVGPAMARPPRRAAVARFGALTGIPVLVMESPRGVNDPALRLAAPRLAQADAVLLLGKRLDFAVRFGEPPAFAADCRFAQIDFDGSAPRGGRVAVAVNADPVLALDHLHAAARALGWRHHPWGEEVAAAGRTEPADWRALRRSSRRPMHPLRVCSALQPLLDRGAILVADGGEFGQWAQAGLEAEVRLINGLSGSIGSAMPMACAARLARPECPVVAVVGDGTFGFHAFELDTAVRHGLPILTVIGNDARWNAEHQLQIRHYGAARTVGCELRLSRYDRVAEALGGHGEFVEAPEDLEPAVDRAVNSGRPACVNVAIDGVAAPVYVGGG
jgi:acetolactate synthase-1/2/3 large subunit